MVLSYSEEIQLEELKQAHKERLIKLQNDSELLHHRCIMERLDKIIQIHQENKEGILRDLKEK